MKLNRVLITLCALVLTACGSGSTQSPDFTPVLTALSVSPTTATVAATETVTFSATGTFTTPPGSGTDSSIEPNTTVSWTTSDPAIATINGQGVATGVAPGTVTVTASKDDITATATLVVGIAPLSALRIEPVVGSVEIASTLQFKAFGTPVVPAGQTGTETELTTGVVWSSSDEEIATIDPATGLASGITIGTVTITAIAGGRTATATLTVTGRLISIRIVPETAMIGLGQTQVFTAVGTFLVTEDPEGETIEGPLTGVLWNAAEPTVAVFDDPAIGTARSVGLGTTQITATKSGKVGTAQLTVGAPVLTSLVIVRQAADGTFDPAMPIAADSVPVNTSRRYRVLGIYSNSTTPRDLDVAETDITWISSNLNAATVTSPGRVTTATVPATAVATTTSILSAAAPGTEPANLILTVNNQQVLTSVEDIIFDPSNSVPLGQVATAIARGRFNDGTLEELPNGLLNWSGSDPTIAVVAPAVGTDGVPTTVTASTSNTGTINVTATLKDGVAADAADRSATAPFTVTDAVCLSKLENPPAPAPELFTNTPLTTGVLCGLPLGLCTASNPGLVVDNQPASFGTLGFTVDALNILLGGSASFTVASTSPAPTIFPGGQPAGFVIAKPAGSLALADVLALAPGITVQTLLAGNPVETSSSTDLIVLDLLGNRLLGPTTLPVLFAVPTTQPYDGLRITVTSAIASLLSNVQVYSACAQARTPAP